MRDRASIPHQTRLVAVAQIKQFGVSGAAGGFRGLNHAAALDGANVIAMPFVARAGDARTGNDHRIDVVGSGDGVNIALVGVRTDSMVGMT